ncbi:uncharacterized protein LOC116939204 [Petromyzon marinus]|uniref:Uncharacterized protein LOC116939204 n=1 Tax=Petromyzon marinus TaxID=7757 RepID=A0AAJ7SPP0_PETMA|nr:uncharacterized protein LOC116939204 [Petromyzon marinus]
MKSKMRIFMLISLSCWITGNPVDGQTAAAAEDCPYPKICSSSEPLNPVVVCGPSEMTVLLRRCVLEALGHTGADLQLLNPACAPSAACYAGEPYVRFLVPHDNPCGSTLSETNASIVFRNAVLSVENVGESWRAKRIHLEFSCSYPAVASLKLGSPSNTVPPGSMPQVNLGIVPTVQSVPGTTTKSIGQLPVSRQNSTSVLRQNNQPVLGTTTKSAGQLPASRQNPTSAPRQNNQPVPGATTKSAGQLPASRQNPTSAPRQNNQPVPGTTTKSAGQLPASRQNPTSAPKQNTQPVFGQTSQLGSGQNNTASPGKTFQAGSTRATQAQFSGIVPKNALLLALNGRSCRSTHDPGALLLLASVLFTLIFVVQK